LKEINLSDYIDSNMLVESETPLFPIIIKTISRADILANYNVTDTSTLSKKEVASVLVDWGSFNDNGSEKLANFKMSANVGPMGRGANPKISEESKTLSTSMANYTGKDLGKFSKLMTRMQNQYDVNPQTIQENKIFIREEDFQHLSKYEKNVIKTIANIYGVMNDPSKDITFEVLQQAMSALGKNKTDNEKSYLLGIFFPEKVRNVHTISPFPIPSYTFNQQFQFFVKPNVKLILLKTLRGKRIMAIL
jgi:hypothetical protein